MPFNVSGFFQRLFNWRNDRDAGIKILAERMDQEMDGIVAGINDIVSGEVDWKGPMTGVFGTAAAPAYSFQEDPNTGVYRVSADVLGFSVGGTKKAEVTATGLNVSGSVTATGLNVSGTTTLDWANVNDGAGSGADADLLDGQHGSFYQNAGNLNAGTIPTARLIGTYNISISGNAATATNATTASNATQLGGIAAASYWHGGNDGSGSGLDADLLDGKHASEFVSQNGPFSKLSGSGANYVNAYLALGAESDTDYRGTGIFCYDDNSKTEWFFGRPYAGSDQFVINRKTGVEPADRNGVTASIANNLVKVNSAGDLLVGDNKVANTDNLVLVTGSFTPNNTYTIPIPSGFTEAQCSFFWSTSGTNDSGYVSNFDRSGSGRTASVHPAAAYAKTGAYIVVARK